MFVIKRDGSEQKFDNNKIKRAIQGAWEDILPKDENIKDEVLDKLTQKVVNKLTDKRAYNVEEIQDIVEFTLMEEKYYDIAKQYISYRQAHKIARNKYKELMDIINDKLKASHVQNQNANLDENTFSGKEKEAISVILKEYALNNLVSEKTRYNHINNIIYIHDLDAYASGMQNCLSIPLGDLLKNGFKVKQTDIRPAGSIGTAMQISAVIMQLQSLCQFGGVSYTHFDWSMIPYVRKSFAKHYKDGLKYVEKYSGIDYEIEHMLNNAVDYSTEDTKYEAYAPSGYKYALEMTEREIHQSVEALYHNLNN